MTAPVAPAVPRVDPDRWDAICIGAGLTSLAFVAQLVARRPDLRVLVLDKHLVAGGYASTFRRPLQQVEFDISLHKLSGMGRIGNTRRILADLGLDRELEIVTPREYFQVSYPDRALTVPNDPAQMKQCLLDGFPHEAAGLARYFDELETHGRNSYFQFQLMDGSLDGDLGTLGSEVRRAHKALRPLRASQALVERFATPQLRDILSLPCSYVGGYPRDFSYLYYLHVVYATLNAGSVYVRGGSQRLSDALVRRIEAAGSRVLLRTRVEQIRTDADGAVVGVATRRGDFATRQVFVNASPHHAVDDLLQPSPVRDAARERIAPLQPSWSTTTLYIATDRPARELGLSSSETYLLDRPLELCAPAHRPDPSAASGNEAAAAAAEAAFWHDAPIEITDYESLSPEAGNVVVLNILDRITHWPERRTPAYKAKKQRVTQVLLDRLFGRFPGFRDHVRYTELSSPRTYQRYTNNTAGAGFGAEHATSGSDGGQGFHRNFPVRGLQFLSTWVAGAGYEAAFSFAEQKAKSWQPQPEVEARPSPEVCR